MPLNIKQNKLMDELYELRWRIHFKLVSKAEVPKYKTAQNHVWAVDMGGEGWGY